MKFLLKEEHDDLAAAIDAMLAKADVATAARAWADEKYEAGLDIWQALTDIGVAGLLVPDEYGGSGAGAVEMVVAAEQLGRHAVPGPVAETLGGVPILLRDTGSVQQLEAHARGDLTTLAAAPFAPRAVDTEVATAYLLDGATLSEGIAGQLKQSVDPTRRLATLTAGEVLDTNVDGSAAIDYAVLATAAQLLGMGQTMLTIAADYAKSRNQFGKPIGSFQAVKHHLADVVVALEMARPLVLGAALALDGQVPDTVLVTREVSAAKVAAGDAAYLAARKSLQVMGAIGYTAEHDISLFITKTRALVSTWGTGALHRELILESLRRTGTSETPR
ncbi:putative acyl-CoA dehydrogenase [Gordonia effusa NBRC 100432]|uniref:Putative acyl-CoA dehydrogenase n=1 Tax=Gordonia effusa NBRC 100432 TaxID=1077974 RepID=H0R4H1_9ACTN|nr:acyl-CoA dehydrogenase family protein [Gordonia effusa]GAB19972.1 putative acyl-CoA dehydrogenase [Gordonia effusa NBRC 100432]